jgi:hypothetical protein
VEEIVLQGNTDSLGVGKTIILLDFSMFFPPRPSDSSSGIK